MNLPCDFEQSIAAHLGQEEYDRLSEALFFACAYQHTAESGKGRTI